MHSILSVRCTGQLLGEAQSNGLPASTAKGPVRESKSRPCKQASEYTDYEIELRRQRHVLTCCLEAGQCQTLLTANLSC
jgi:hypothetical protein